MVDPNSRMVKMLRGGRSLVFTGLCVALCHRPIVAKAQDRLLFDLSLEELLDVRVTVATGFDQSIREAPNVISVVTAEEIGRSHARDLADVFQMVPGLNVAKDLDNLSLMSRGLYGFEGRTLVMMDGLRLSGLGFGSFAFGNSIPVHLIDRIEVIRGPGSVIYGGTAELAVINIISKSGASLQGGEFAARGGRLPTAPGHLDFGGQWGQRSGDWEYRLLAFRSEGRRSDGAYPNFDRRPVLEHDRKSAGLDSTLLAGEVRWREQFYFKANLSRYRNHQIKGFDVPGGLSPEDTAAAIEAGIEDARTVITWENAALETGFDLASLDRFAFGVSFGYQYNLPFERPRRDDFEVGRWQMRAHGAWTGEDWEVIAGFEWQQDDACMVRDPDPDLRNLAWGFRARRNDEVSESISTSGTAAYTSLQYAFGNLKAHLGARYEHNKRFDAQFLPRTGLVWVEGNFHSKLLFAAAFREPLAFNNVYSKYGLDPSKPWREPVLPEKTRVAEWEIGYKMGDHCLLNTNFFFQEVSDIIEYRYSVAHDDLHSDNGGRLGTWGAEAEIELQFDGYHGLINFSHFQPVLSDHPNPDAYAIDPKGGDTYLALHRPGKLMGVPQWKLYTQHSLTLSARWSATVDALYLSTRYGAKGTANGQTGDIASQLILGCGFRYNGPLEGMVLSLSIHDLTNERLDLVTPFWDGGYDTLPYKGREVSFGMVYRF